MFKTKKMGILSILFLLIVSSSYGLNTRKDSFPNLITAQNNQNQQMEGVYNYTLSVGDTLEITVVHSSKINEI